MKVTFVVGPTACGKSELALRLAENAEAAGRPAAIVNCDSIQVYQKPLAHGQRADRQRPPLRLPGK